MMNQENNSQGQNPIGLFSLDLIKIDLRQYDTSEEFKRLRDDNGIPEEKLCEIKVIDLKKSIDVIFLDSATFNLMMYIPKGSQDIYLGSDIENFLHSIKPIKFKKKKVAREILTLDGILDKISSTGIESLTERERIFLQNSSNKED